MGIEDIRKKLSNAIGRRISRKKDDPKVILEEAKTASDEALYEKNPATGRSLYTRLLEVNPAGFSSNEYSDYVSLLTKGLDRYKEPTTPKERDRRKKTYGALLDVATHYSHQDAETIANIAEIILNNEDAKLKVRNAALESLAKDASNLTWNADTDELAKGITAIRKRYESIRTRAFRGSSAHTDFLAACSNASTAMAETAGDRAANRPAAPKQSTVAPRRRTRVGGWASTDSRNEVIDIDGVSVSYRSAKASLQPQRRIIDDVVRLLYARRENAYNAVTGDSGKPKVLFAEIPDVMRMAQQEAPSFTPVPDDVLPHLDRTQREKYLADRSAFNEQERFRERAKSADLVLLPLNDQKLTQAQLEGRAEYHEGGNHWMTLSYAPSTKTFYFHNSSDDKYFDQLAKEMAANIYSYLAPVGAEKIDIEKHFVKRKAEQQDHGSNCALFMDGNLGAILQEGKIPPGDVSKKQLKAHMQTREGLITDFEAAKRDHKSPAWHVPDIDEDVIPEVLKDIAKNVDGGVDWSTISVKPPSDDCKTECVYSDDKWLVFRSDHFERDATDSGVEFKYSDEMIAKLLSRIHDTSALQQLQLYFVPKEDEARTKGVSLDATKIAVGDIVELQMVGEKGRPGSVNIVSVTPRDQAQAPFFEKQKIMNRFDGFVGKDFNLKTVDEVVNALKEGESLATLPLRDGQENIGVGDKAYLHVISPKDKQARLIEGKELVVSIDHSRMPEIKNGELVSVARRNEQPEIRRVPSRDRLPTPERKSTESTTRRTGGAHR